MKKSQREIQDPPIVIDISVWKIFHAHAEGRFAIATLAFLTTAMIAAFVFYASIRVVDASHFGRLGVFGDRAVSVPERTVSVEERDLDWGDTTALL